VLFVGLIPFEHREKEAFQEFDPHAWFGTGTKRVMVLDHPERASEIVAEAMFAASSGRPGPVVVGLPEDIIKEEIDARLHPQIPVDSGGMTVTDWKQLHDALLEPEKPLFITGGNDWTDEASRQLTAWLEDHTIAGAVEWRTQGAIAFEAPSSVGSTRYGRAIPTYDLLEETDFSVFVGSVPGETVTDGFTILQTWDKKNFLVTIAPALRGRSGPVSR